MEKPNLDRTWETFVNLGLIGFTTRLQVYNAMRSKLCPMLSSLKSGKKIKWYCFLLHDRKKLGDPNLYFHIRFEPEDGINDKEAVNKILWDYCDKDKTARFTDVEPKPKEISNIDNSQLKDEEIEEAWKILGEQSEWVMNMVNSHKENMEITEAQIAQFMHFFLNMFGLGCKAILYGEKGNYQF